MGLKMGSRGLTSRVPREVALERHCLPSRQSTEDITLIHLESDIPSQPGAKLWRWRRTSQGEYWIFGRNPLWSVGRIPFTGTHSRGEGWGDRPRRTGDWAGGLFGRPTQLEELCSVEGLGVSTAWPSFIHWPYSFWWTLSTVSSFQSLERQETAEMDI